MIDLSILDYSPIDENTSSQDALRATTKLANLADSLGFRRFWVSEHHGMQTLAGSNPEMLMMHLAASTQSIRIGSGGVMLQHYSAYRVAEGIKLIEALYPGRIDLGVGRAPGGDKLASAALNLGKSIIVPYGQQLHDLKKYFSDHNAYRCETYCGDRRCDHNRHHYKRIMFFAKKNRHSTH